MQIDTDKVDMDSKELFQILLASAHGNLEDALRVACYDLALKTQQLDKAQALIFKQAIAQIPDGIPAGYAG